jgi:hypothetical protein
MTVQEYTFEQRLAKAWLRQNGTLAPELIESHTELVALVNEFSMALEIVMPFVEAHKIKPDDLEYVSSFIGSLKLRDIEKHYLLSVRIANQVVKQVSNSDPDEAMDKPIATPDIYHK